MIDFLNNLAQDKKKLFIVVFIALLVVVLDYNFVIIRLIRNAQESSPKITKLRIDLNTLSRDLANLEATRKNHESNGNTKDAVGKVLISQQDMPVLLQEVSKIANKNNIKLVKMQPLAKSAKPGNPVSVGIALELKGDYHSFGRFINDLENAKQFIVVENLDIKSDGSDYAQQNINLLLKTYVR